MLSEEEIINKIDEIIEYSKLTTDIGIADQTDKIEAIQGLLDLYNKEKEKNKELEKGLNNAVSEQTKLTRENTKLRKENHELENADLTTVYMNGFYDGEKKWKDKIKEKLNYIQSTYSQINGDYFMMNNTIETLEELLEERN